ARLDPEELADRRDAHPARSDRRRATSGFRDVGLVESRRIERVSARRIGHRDFRSPRLGVKLARASIELLERVDELPRRAASELGRLLDALRPLGEAAHRILDALRAAGVVL